MPIYSDKGQFAFTTREKCEWRKKRLKVFPNQALYQAEPQPEITEFVPRTRSLTSRILDLNRKDKELVCQSCFTNRRLSKIRPCFPQPTSELSHFIDILLWAGQSGAASPAGLAAWLEITLCSFGQKALTTSRFIWKVSTHFYHARTATCSIRPHK